MKKRRLLPCIGAALGMLILILDGKTAITGAQEGLSLCIRTLIPSLFPYLILSTLLTGALMGQPLKLLRPIGRLTGIPEGTESLMAVGLLGGYPAGAVNTALAWRRGQISKNAAERLLSFCNNAGPAFLFGIIRPIFSDIKTAWLLWAVHIISALLVGFLTAEGTSKATPSHNRDITLTEALEHSVKVMALICGWVVLFRILLSFLERWFLWLLSTELQVLLSGILELSNGCIQLCKVQNEGLRFVMAAVLLSLGGICVTMQTASAAAGLSLKLYFPSKLLQCCFSFLLGMLLQFMFPDPQRWACPSLVLTLVTALAVILGLYLKRNKKISSIPAFVGV